MLKVIDMGVGYGQKLIIDEFYTEIIEGEIVSIIGPNGSGKSTILKAVGKLLKPQGGSIYVDGKSVYKMPAKQLAQNIAMVSQHNPMPNDISVGELVYYGRMPHKKWYEQKTERDTHRVKWAMKNTKILDMEYKKVSELSGGERQRVWLAMALVQEPKVLLLDEPTTYLDISHQLEIMELIKKLNEELNLTVLMVLHDLNHAALYSDRVIVLKDGRVVDEGIPQRVLTRELVRYVYNVDIDILHDSMGQIFAIVPRAVV